jgi:hypothetical protein
VVLNGDTIIPIKDRGHVDMNWIYKQKRIDKKRLDKKQCYTFIFISSNDSEQYKTRTKDEERKIYTENK